MRGALPLGSVRLLLCTSPARVQEPGKPLFVSLLLYLDAEWKRDWDAETLFLDVASDVGILVRPKASQQPAPVLWGLTSRAGLLYGSGLLACPV